MQVRSFERLSEWSAGRSIADGYVRGWGLEFGNLPEEVAADPVYMAADGVSWRRSHLSAPKKQNLFLIVARYLGALESQNIIEFGSYKGGTAMFLAAILKQVAPAARVYALDTFCGMPPTDPQLDMHVEGNFSDVSYEDVAAAVAEAGLDNLTLVQGDFRETFPALTASGVSFGLAHIDCDVYDGVKYSQEAVWPHMAAGGYVVYDDALVSSCIGAMQAVEEFVIDRRIHSEQVFPHLVFRAGAPIAKRRSIDIEVPLFKAADDFRADVDAARRRPIGDGLDWRPFDFSGLHPFATLPACAAAINALPGKRVADIGAGDGDLAFLLERIGCEVDLLDHAPANANQLRGARTLRARLGSRVAIYDIDLDGHAALPRDYDFAFLMDVLWRLKDPGHALERVARRVRAMALSTRVAAWNDPADLRALIERSGWQVVESCVTRLTESDLLAPNGDRRAFWHLRSAVLER